MKVNVNISYVFLKALMSDKSWWYASKVYLFEAKDMTCIWFELYIWQFSIVRLCFPEYERLYLDFCVSCSQMSLLYICLSIFDRWVISQSKSYVGLPFTVSKQTISKCHKTHCSRCEDQCWSFHLHLICYITCTWKFMVYSPIIFRQNVSNIFSKLQYTGRWTSETDNR